MIGHEGVQGFPQHGREKGGPTKMASYYIYESTSTYRFFINYKIEDIGQNMETD